MSDEIYDPYDVNNYVKPISPNNKRENPYSFEDKDESSTTNSKKVFNTYENNEDQSEKLDEDSPLKNDKKKKSKRKKTDEGISENIDLTKNAYDDDINTKSDNNINSDKNSNNEFENGEELPLLEELGINPQSIKNKIIGVLTLRRIDKKFLEDSDMAGPILIFLSFAFSLVLQYKSCFGYIYGISLFGSLLLFLLLNLMSKNNSILLYNTISVLGYCLIPIVFLSFLAIVFSMKNFFGAIFCSTAIILSSLNASRFFEIALEMYSQRWLIFYPVALFYTCFVLVTIY